MPERDGVSGHAHSRRSRFLRSDVYHSRRTALLIKHDQQFVKRSVAIQDVSSALPESMGEKYSLPRRPGEVIAGLRAGGSRIDLFTFLQRPPETSPKFAYPMEWDNLAVLPISTYDTGGLADPVYRKEQGSAGREKGRDCPRSSVRRALPPWNRRISITRPRSARKRFPHYGMDLEGARRYAGTFLDRSFFIGALLEDNFLGSSN